MFSVGDTVCYPMNGVGTVEAIEEKTVQGEAKLFYRLHFETGHLTVSIPVSNAASVGLRQVTDAQTAEAILSFMQGGDCSEESSNWNQRYRDNYEKLKTGDIRTTADVVKCLWQREKKKGLSAGERKMYLSARQTLVAELSCATGRSAEEILTCFQP